MVAITCGHCAHHSRCAGRCVMYCSITGTTPRAAPRPIWRVLAVGSTVGASPLLRRTKPISAKWPSQERGYCDSAGVAMDSSIRRRLRSKHEVDSVLDALIRIAPLGFENESISNISPSASAIFQRPARLVSALCRFRVGDDHVGLLLEVVALSREQQRLARELFGLRGIA